MSDRSNPGPEELLSQMDWIRSLARQLVGDEHSAEDMVQDTALVAMRRRPGDPSKLRQWLGRVLRNQVHQHKRASTSRVARERRAALEEATESTFESLARVSMQDSLMAAVMRLSDVNRTTILLRFFENLPQREIAIQMQTTVATVNSRLTRSLAQIRSELDTEYGDRRAWVLGCLPLLPARHAPVASLATLATHVALPIWIAATILISGLTLVFWNPGGVVHGPGKLPVAEPGQSRVGTLGGGELPSAAQGGAGVELAQRIRDTYMPVLRFAEGKVLDARARPVSGIAIRFHDDPELSAISDPEGRFRLRAAESTGQLMADSEDYVTVFAGAYTQGSLLEPLVIVAPALTIGGQIVDPTGLPITGAYLRLEVPEGFATRFRDPLDKSRKLRWQGLTDANGRFDMPRVPLIAGATLIATRQPYDARLLSPPAFTDRRMLIVMHKPAAVSATILRGRVIDHRGALVKGAIVALGMTSTQTDRHGAFEISLPRAGGARQVTAVKEGMLPAFYSPPSEASGTIPRWPDSIELHLPGPSRSIFGVVLDKDGEPMPDALVWVEDPVGFGLLGFTPVQIEYLAAGGKMPRYQSVPFETADGSLTGDQYLNTWYHAREPSSAWHYVTTNHDGEFELTGLQDRAYRLRAMNPLTLHSGYASAAPGGDDAVLWMPEAETTTKVAGQIVSADGEPLVDIRVLQISRIHSASYAIPGGKLDSTLIKHGPITSTDSGGRFYFDEVPKDDILLSIYADNIMPLIIPLVDIGIREDIRLVAQLRCHFEVILADPTLADSIRATDGAGESVALGRLRSGRMDIRPRIALVEGGSGVLAASDRMRRVVLLKDGQVIEEIPIALEPGKPTIVRR